MKQMIIRPLNIVQTLYKPLLQVCLTPEDVPFKNPDNVMGRGHASNNLVISWTVSFFRDLSGIFGN